VSLDRPGVDDVRVRHALATAQADTFVARLHDELDTRLGERGTSLSGGQRQRLTLARALAGQPRLLILDDATSAVDPRVEARILAALRGAAPLAARPGGPPGRRTTEDSPPASITILVVAYRRATIALADEVVYIESGRVVAHGTHEQLLASVPGYIELVTAYEKAEEEREREHVYDADAAVVEVLEEEVAA
jgi:ABC-type multidrug transport system fused ATPase/permease subunit